MLNLLEKSEIVKVETLRKGGNTSNLFSHSMITSDIVINLKVQYILE